MLFLLTKDLIPIIHQEVVSHLPIYKSGFSSELNALLMKDEPIDTKGNLHDLLIYFGYSEKIYNISELESKLYKAIVNYYAECTGIIFNCVNSKKIEIFKDTLIKMFEEDNWKILYLSSEDNNETTNPISIALKKSHISDNGTFPYSSYYHETKIIA